MGTYNIVTGQIGCPRCHSIVTARAQFKYGDAWQHLYAVGDELRWGGNQIGRRVAGRVVVDAVAETSCPVCGHGGGDDDWDLYVVVEDGRIRELRTATGEYDFVKAGGTFIEGV